MRKPDRIANSDRKEHPDGELEIDMLGKGEVSVYGEKQCQKLQAMAEPGNLWAIYRNGRQIIAWGVSTGILVWSTFRNEPKLSLRLQEFEILAQPEFWGDWVSPQSLWVPSGRP
jgi:hypothetical protein